MSLNLYVTQIIGIAAVLLILLRHQSWVLQAQVIVWSIGTAAIALRFGLVEQLSFYSNDQRQYTNIVRTFSDYFSIPDVDWWMSLSRFPYTLPAFVIHSVGIEPALALKTVSLMCLLLLTHYMLSAIQPLGRMRAVVTILFTGCGMIGLFFSALALRETMMMLLATRFVQTNSSPYRFFIATLLLLLRPHLAVSLVMGALLVWGFQSLRRSRRETLMLVVIAVVGGSLAGWLLYSVGVSFALGSQSFLSHSWGIQPVIRITSNFFGLQFLTVGSHTVEFSLQSLLLLRLILVETILIPSVFTLLIVTRPHRMHYRSMLITTSFSIYVGLVTNTDFNSFRQNIPFMPVMGLVILAMTGSTPKESTRPRIANSRLPVAKRIEVS